MAAVTLTVRVFAPVSQVAARPLRMVLVSSLVPLLVISMVALASAGMAVTVLVASVVAAV